MTPQASSSFPRRPSRSTSTLTALSAPCRPSSTWLRPNLHDFAQIWPDLGKLALAPGLVHAHFLRGRPPGAGPPPPFEGGLASRAAGRPRVGPQQVGHHPGPVRGRVHARGHGAPSPAPARAHPPLHVTWRTPLGDLRRCSAQGKVRISEAGEALVVCWEIRSRFSCGIPSVPGSQNQEPDFERCFGVWDIFISEARAPQESSGTWL